MPFGENGNAAANLTKANPAKCEEKPKSERKTRDLAIRILLAEEDGS
jgi:hypothetical protein